MLPVWCGGFLVSVRRSEIAFPKLRALRDGCLQFAVEESVDARDHLRGEIAGERERLCAGQRVGCEQRRDKRGQQRGECHRTSGSIGAAHWARLGRQAGTHKRRNAAQDCLADSARLEAPATQGAAVAFNGSGVKPNTDTSNGPLFPLTPNPNELTAGESAPPTTMMPNPSFVKFSDNDSVGRSLPAAALH